MAKKSKEFTFFNQLVDRLLAVPRAELQKREAQYREQAAQNPKKRGPKRKALTPSAAHHDGV
jgi:hypothetical protein